MKRALYIYIKYNGYRTLFAPHFGKDLVQGVQNAMPASTLDFRHVCGCFVSVFIGFMNKRVKEKVSMRVHILTLRCRAAGVMVGVLLTLLFWGDLLHRCGDIEKNPGPTETRATNRSYSKDSLEAASGQQQTEHGEPTLRDVMTILTSMNSKFDEMKDDVKHLKGVYSALKDEMCDLQDEVTNLKRINDDLLNENEAMKSKIENLECITDDLAGRSRRNNILFYGMPRSSDTETNEECEARIQEILTDQLEIAENVQFDRVHRLGKDKTSPIIACCTLYKQKVVIMKAERKLKEGNTGIFIGDDFTQRVRVIRKSLVPHLKKAREEGKKASMVFDHIVMNGKKMALDCDGNLVEKK